jgi:CO/xanthine dehydrogenase Mo-binding subunit
MSPTVVKHIGEQFAAVIAKSAYTAAYGVEAVEIDRESLPVARRD